MTEMVYGSNPVRVSEPVIPRWWRTIDKWTLTSVFVLFGVGLLLGLAASVPLATRNGLEPFYYVQRQAVFGGIALVVMLASLTLLALGIFGPGVATGLVSGAPQLGAGAAAGTALGVAGTAVAAGAVATGVGGAVVAMFTRGDKD